MDKNKKIFIILIIALILRVWGISFGLPGIDHGDETEVVNHAVRFGSGDFNPHRFQYGSLFQYILFIFYSVYFFIGYFLGTFSSVHQFAIHFIQDPTLFYLIARWLSAILGSITLGITYLIGKRIKSEEVGLLSALLLAFCYQHAVHSHYGTVDIVLTFFFTLAVYQCLVLFDHNTLLWRYFLAGFCIGLTTAVKFNGILSVATFLSIHFLRRGNISLLNKLFCKKLWLGIGAIFIGHFIACPYFYVDLDIALAEIVQLRTMHTSYSFNLWIYICEFAKNYWGIPLGVICILGWLRAVITTERKMLTLFFTVSTVICFASLHRYVEAKYVLYSFPLFSVVGSILLMECFAHVTKRYSFLIVLVLLVHPGYLIGSWDYQRAKKSITLEAKEWIEEHIPINSKILLDNAGNAGPKIENSPGNLKRQYQKALKHNLLKAEYLKLKLESPNEIYYNIIHIDCSGGFREDDYQRYRLWQDVEQIGKSPEYYRAKGFEYIIVTDRYFSQMGKGFKLIKEFKRERRGIRIYIIYL